MDDRSDDDRRTVPSPTRQDRDRENAVTSALSRAALRLDEQEADEIAKDLAWVRTRRIASEWRAGVYRMAVSALLPALVTAGIGLLIAWYSHLPPFSPLGHGPP